MNLWLRCWSLRDQLLVAIVEADPEPDQAFRAIPCQCTEA